MCRTLHSILTVALAVLCVASAVSLAAEETVSGTVENVDPQQGRMILRGEEGKAMELRAPTDLLIGLQNGDAVEVKLSGQRATFIQKQEGVQRPDMDGALRLQPPVDMPKSREPCCSADDYTSAKRPTSCKHACNSATSAWYA